MIGKFKRLIWLWTQCFKSMRNLKTFVPFFLYAILQIFLVYALVNFSHSPFSNLLIPIIRKFFGEPALHYPNFFYIMAPLYNQINLLISGLLGIIVIGVATHLFGVKIREDKLSLSNALKATMPKYGVLLIIWIIESALTLAMIIGVPQVLNNLLQPDYTLSRIINLAGFLLGIGVASVFAYTTMLIVLDDQKLIHTISQTFLIFKKNMFTSFLLVAVPTFFYFPISYILKETDLLISKFSPEIVVVVLGTGIFISFLSSYFQIGTITQFYIFINEKKKY